MGKISDALDKFHIQKGNESGSTETPLNIIAVKNLKNKVFCLKLKALFSRMRMTIVKFQ